MLSVRLCNVARAHSKSYALCDWLNLLISIIDTRMALERLIGGNWNWEIFRAVAMIVCPCYEKLAVLKIIWAIILIELVKALKKVLGETVHK